MTTQPIVLSTRQFTSIIQTITKQSLYPEISYGSRGMHTKSDEQKLTYNTIMHVVTKPFIRNPILYKKDQFSPKFI